MGPKKGIPPIPPEEIERLLVSSAPMIRRHAAIIHLESDFIYSGVYAKSFGCEGILTAGHCASAFLAAKHIALCVSDAKHQLWVESKAFEHVPIGYDETEGYTSNGPDLSFVIIRDETLLGVIRSQNLEFYDLDNHKAKEVFGNPFDTINWAVEGNPGEKIELKKELVSGKVQTTTVTTDALIQGNFAGFEVRDHFDYVTILVGSGFEEFPASYTGVSGGGIWYQRFVTSDGKTYQVEPILAGIACWQSKRILKKGYKVREITGHGFASIYGHVRKALVWRESGQNRKRDNGVS